MKKKPITAPLISIIVSMETPAKYTPIVIASTANIKISSGILKHYFYLVSLIPQSLKTLKNLFLQTSINYPNAEYK
jgi:hypothetical protein